MSSSCSSCGRAIVWAISPNGARLPLDARPMTVYALDAATDPPKAVKVLDVATDGPPVELPAPLYISHFVTCPDRDKFSRSKSSKP